MHPCRIQILRPDFPLQFDYQSFKSIIGHEGCLSRFFRNRDRVGVDDKHRWCSSPPHLSFLVSVRGGGVIIVLLCQCFLWRFRRRGGTQGHSWPCCCVVKPISSGRIDDTCFRTSRKESRSGFVNDDIRMTSGRDYLILRVQSSHRVTFSRK